MSGVTLVIPNRDGAAYLPDCLDAVAALRPGPDETVVVDDASADDSMALLRARYPWVRVLASGPDGRPQGFARTCNVGIAAAAADHDIALLNNDTRIEPGWLGALADALGHQPGAASVASRMLQKDGAHVNACGLLLGGDGTCRALGDGTPDGPRFDRACEVFGASGGAALWRRAALDALGGFDETFFAYYEDADLAWRARAAGWTAVYAPAARVIHTEGRCPSLRRIDKVRLRIRNGLWFAWSCLPAGVLVRRFPRIAWATGWRYFFKYGLRPWKVEGRAFWLAIAEVKFHPVAFWRRRCARQAGRTVPAGALVRWMGRDPFAEAD
ncbi:MAG: glycosyltransferase family 2 protein [Planctomycetota bacterium]